VQTELSVQVENAAVFVGLRKGDRGSGLVIVGFAVGDDDAESVNSPPQK